MPEPKEVGPGRALVLVRDLVVGDEVRITEERAAGGRRLAGHVTRIERHTGGARVWLDVMRSDALGLLVAVDLLVMCVCPDCDGWTDRDEEGAATCLGCGR